MLITGGKSPFYAGSRFKTIARILSCQYGLNIPELAHISSEAKAFIRDLLTVDPPMTDETLGVPGAPVAPHSLGQRHPVHDGDEVDETAARQAALAPLVQRSPRRTKNQKAERHLLSSFVSCYHPISNKQSPGGPV